MTSKTVEQMTPQRLRSKNYGNYLARAATIEFQNLSKNCVFQSGWNPRVSIPHMQHCTILHKSMTEWHTNFAWFQNEWMSNTQALITSSHRLPLLLNPVIYFFAFGSWEHSNCSWSTHHVCSLHLFLIFSHKHGATNNMMQMSYWAISQKKLRWNECENEVREKYIKIWLTGAFLALSFFLNLSSAPMPQSPTKYPTTKNIIITSVI